MSTKQPWYQSILFILVFAFVIRMVAAGYWQSNLAADQKFRFGDSDGYWQLAKRVAHGEPYQYNSEHAKVFRTPGYPVFLAPMFWFWDDPPVMVARFLGVLLGVVSVWLVWCIAARLFSNRVAWYSAWLVCLYPGAIAISILVLAESLFVPLMLIQFMSLIWAFDSKDKTGFVKWTVMSGVVNGLACLTRPSWILFIPFLIAGSLIFFGNRKQQLQFLLVSSIGTIVLMTPWWIRNYQVTGKFVLTSLQTGTSLYDGLNPGATGASDMQFAPPMKKEALQEYRQKKIGPEREFEYWFNERMKDEALGWAKKNPARVAELAMIKFRRIWNPLPNADEIGSGLMRWGIALFFVPALLLAIIGGFVHRQNFIVMAICIWPTIYFTCIHMVFVGSIRYRQPPLVTLLILAGAVLAVCFAGKHSKAHDN